MTCSTGPQGGIEPGPLRDVSSYVVRTLVGRATEPPHKNLVTHYMLYVVHHHSWLTHTGCVSVCITVFMCCSLGESQPEPAQRVPPKGLCGPAWGGAWLVSYIHHRWRDHWGEGTKSAKKQNAKSSLNNYTDRHGITGPSPDA